MDLETFKHKFHVSNAPESWCSLYEGLKPGALILQQYHGIWEVFYYDERGNSGIGEIFHSEEKALDYLWQKIELSLKVFKITPKNE